MRLFVYGTLKNGYSNFNNIPHHLRPADIVENVYVSGELYSFEKFPALMPYGQGLVKGELFYFRDNHTFSKAVDYMDNIEGFDMYRPALFNIYQRVFTNVYDDENILVSRAYTYIMTLEGVTQNKGVKIQGNEWVEVKNGAESIT